MRRSNVQVTEQQGVPSTLAEMAYQHLRRDIVTGALAPGQPLRLESLKQRYGLSFSPLREALNRLQTERLVDMAALRGFSVSLVSAEEMWDATEVRILVECEALRRSIRDGGDDWEAGIVAAFHALDLQARRMPTGGEVPSGEQISSLEIRHHDFHQALIAKCRSRRLIDMANQLYAETHRYRLPALLDNTPAPSRDVPREHREIMEATLARRSNEAQALLAMHYRRTAEFVEKGIPSQ